jgi:hypothetical protein
MAINVDAIKNRLKSLQSNESSVKKTDDVWKPAPGAHTVRIVPYMHNRENPFIEMYFHYNVGKKTYLSPVTFGKPDPIVEFAEKLKQTGSKEDWIMGRKLEPKMRVHVPVIVRGQENEGVKFWGFGTTVYQELLAYIADPDYGDITDMQNGRDITVEVKTPEETGKNFQTTTIRIKPKETPVTTDKAVVDLIKNQKQITEIFKEQTYEDLKLALHAWLNPESETETGEAEVNYTTDKSTATKSIASDVSSAFDDLFKD